MKRALMLALATGGLMLATSGDASAGDYFRTGRVSGFGVSLNLGSPYGYNSGYRSQFRHRGVIAPSLYNQPYFAPRNYRRAVPAYGFGGLNNYGYGGGYGIPAYRGGFSRGYGCGY